MVWNLVSRQSLPDEVVQQVVALIDNKEIAPGATLPPELELVKIWGVGRSTVREALERLVALGIVSRTRAGTVVAGDVEIRLREMRWLESFREQTVDNLYEARIALEASGAQLAAERASEGDVHQLEVDVQALQDALTQGSAEILSVDLAFHRHLMDASHNPILANLHEILLGRFLENLPNVGSIAGLGDISLENHQKVLRTIRQKDGAGAAAAVRDTLGGVHRRVRDSLPEVDTP